MSTIKINELADGSLALNTLSVFADQNGLAFKRNLSDFKDFLSTLDDTAFKGKLLIADTPVDGWYFAGESGTYTNAGSLVVDVSDNISIIIVSNSVTTFEKVDIPVTITIDSTVIDGSSNAVSGNAVYDEFAKIKNDLNTITHSFSLSKNITYVVNGSVLEVTVPETIVGWNDSHQSVLAEATYDLNDTDFIYVDVDIDSNTTSGWQIGVRNTNDYNSPSPTSKRLILCNRKGSRLGNVNAFIGLQRLNRDGDLDAEWLNDKDAYNGSNQQEVNRIVFDDLASKTSSISVNTNNISSNLDLINTNKTQTDVLNSMQDNGIFYRSFDSTSNSYGTLNSEITLSAIGDYIEFIAIGEDRVGSPYNLGAFGKFSVAGQLLGWYNNDTIRLRGSDGAYVIFSGLNYRIDRKNKYKVEIVGTDWVLSINDQVVGTQPKIGDLTILNVGNSYSNNAIFDLFYLKIHNASTDLEITDFYNDTNITYEVDAVLKYQPDVYQPTYVECNPNGSSEIGGGDADLLSFKIHTQSKANKKKYATIIVDRYFLPTDNLRRTDYFRITGAYESIFDGNKFIKTGIDLMSSGESEFVYGRQNRYDLSGGIHGNEYYTDIYFFVDGVRFEETTKLSGLIPCSEFRYVVKSDIHTPPATDGTPVVGYPVETTHIKDTVIRNGGYETWNEITGVIEITDFTNIYINLFSVSSDVADYAQLVGEYTPTQMVNDGVDKLITTDLKDMMYWDASNDNSVRVTSDSYNLDEGARVRIKDSSTQPYCKYYKDLSFADNWDDVLSIGEKFSGWGKIEFISK